MLVKLNCRLLLIESGIQIQHIQSCKYVLRDIYNTDGIKFETIKIYNTFLRRRGVCFYQIPAKNIASNNFFPNTVDNQSGVELFF